MFRLVGIRRVESRVIQAEMMEASKEGKAELRVIRGQGRLEYRLIEEERREGRNEIKVEISDTRGLRIYDK